MAGTVVLNEGSLRTAELRQHVYLARLQLRRVGKRLRLKLAEVLSASSNKFSKVTIIHAALVVAVYALEAEHLGVALVLVQVGLDMEVGVSRIGSVWRILVGAEEGTRHTRYRRINLSLASVGIL